MTSPRIRVLLVEDNPGDARLIRALLEEAGPARFELRHTETLRDGVTACQESEPDVVLLDLNLPDERGTETVARIHAAAPRVPIVVLTGTTDEDAAVRAVEQGAQEYLVKGRVDGTLLVRAIRHAVVRHRAVQSERLLTEEVAARTRAREELDRTRLIADAAHGLVTRADTSDLGWLAEQGARVFGGAFAIDLGGDRRIATAAVDAASAEPGTGLLAPSALGATLGGVDERGALVEHAQARGFEALAAAGVLSAAAAPISYRTQRLGTVALWSRQRRYGAADLETLRRLGDLLGFFLSPRR